MAAEILIGKRGKQNQLIVLEHSLMKQVFISKNQSDALLNRTTKTKKRFEDIDIFSNWELIGWMGILAGILILSFYSVIAGWTIYPIFLNLYLVHLHLLLLLDHLQSLNPLYQILKN